MSVTKDNKCKISHFVEARYRKDCQGNRGSFPVKCANRLCYNNKLQQSDYCFQHHIRDECPRYIIGRK